MTDPSNPTWSEVRARLRERSLLKGRRPAGGAGRAGPFDEQDAPVHDDHRQGTMKEPSRRGPPGRGSSERRPPRPRPRDDDDEPRGFAAPRGGGSDELLELADELEEQARALMQQARRLQRMAQSMERGDAGAPPRPRGPRPGGFSRGGPRREGPRREGEERRPRARSEEDRPRKRPDDEGPRPRKRSDDEGPRPRKRTGDAPGWAPKGKKRKP